MRCHYHPETNPYCPVFRLGYIAEQAREKFSDLCKTVSQKKIIKMILSYPRMITSQFSICVLFVLYHVLSICKLLHINFLPCNVVTMSWRKE